MAHIIGIVLAGGASRRMGTDKGLLPFPGYQHLLERQLALLQALPLDQLLVSRHSQQLEPPLNLQLTPQLTRQSQTLAGPQISIVLDQDRNNRHGPLAGIASALEQCPQADGALILPVDLPLMNASSLSLLLPEPAEPDCNRYFENNYLPLYLRTDSMFREALRQTLAEGQDLSIRRLLARFPRQVIEVDCPTRLLNANTPDQYARTLEGFSFAADSFSKSRLFTDQTMR